MKQMIGGVGLCTIMNERLNISMWMVCLMGTMQWQVSQHAPFFYWYPIRMEKERKCYSIIPSLDPILFLPSSIAAVAAFCS